MPGGHGYELSYSVTGVLEYLLSISPFSSPAITASTYSDPNTTHALKATFDAIAKHEQVLIEKLLGFLISTEAQQRGVRLVGTETGGDSRVPTISFVVVDGEKGKSMTSQDVVKVFDNKGGVSLPATSSNCEVDDLEIGIRYGHFYAYTLVDHLEPKIDPSDAVVRISLVHYNTVEEVDRIIEVLKEALGL